MHNLTLLIFFFHKAFAFYRPYDIHEINIKKVQSIAYDRFNRSFIRLNCAIFHSFQETRRPTLLCLTSCRREKMARETNLILNSTTTSELFPDSSENKNWKGWGWGGCSCCHHGRDDVCLCMWRGGGGGGAISDCTDTYVQIKLSNFFN